MNADVIPVESIQERDIDMLLLEELSIDDSFGSWMIQELNLSPLLKMNGVWRSVSGIGMGETDILFSYNSAAGKIFLLVENKISAPFTKDQYKRYQLRAKRLMEKGDCIQSFCILIAPEKYCSSQTDFQTLSYEKIQSWFAKFATKRAAFKNQILQIAITKQRRGRIISDFCAHYWKLFSDSEYMDDFRKPAKSATNEKVQFTIINLPNFTVYHLFELESRFKVVDCEEVRPKLEPLQAVSHCEEERRGNLVNKPLICRQVRPHRHEIAASFLLL